MLTVNNLSHSFTESKIILENINFELNEGEILAIVGESGSGKSTLLNAIAGKLNYDGGTILFDKEKVLKPKQQLIAGHDEIALVNQNYSGDLYFTVAENIKNQLLHLTNEDRDEMVEELLMLFDLSPIKNYQSHLLSGGEKQRLSMACALAKEPKILLLDEPFSHLDVFLRNRVGRYLKNIVEEKGLSIIIVTHEGEEALDWAHNIVILEKGLLSEKATPKNAYYYPENLIQARFFGEINQVEISNSEKISFRPWNFVLDGKKDNNSLIKIKVKFLYSSFRMGYYANYFHTFSGEEIVLYDFKELTQVKSFYVESRG